MITKTWKIDSMQAYPQHAGQSNVVFVANWRLNGTDGAYNATIYNSIALDYKEGDPYTPYEQLTEEVVVNWVKEAMGPEAVAAHEANIDNQIDALVNPTVVVLPNPWNS